MPTVVVDVYDNQVLIERCERVLRRLPDGAPGVSFRGVVYPLRDHSRVDLQDAWAYEMHCPVARSLPTGWPTGRPHSSGVSWCLESGGYAPYLFLNCTRQRQRRSEERSRRMTFPSGNSAKAFERPKTGFSIIGSSGWTRRTQERSMQP